MAKNKSLKHINNKLENEVLELKIKLQHLEKGKEVFIECETCLEVINENEKLKDKISKLDKVENSSNSLKKIISVQGTSVNKTGVGFNSTNVSTSENKNVKFECKLSKQKPLDSKPKYILVKDRKIPIASDEEVKSFYKPSLKAKTRFSKPKLRSKTPPPNRPNNPNPRSKTPQPRRNQGRQNLSNNSHPMWIYPHQPSFSPWGIFSPYMHPSQLQTMFGSNNFGPMRPWEPSG
jgi:exonuclease VII small subunit